MPSFALTAGGSAAFAFAMRAASVAAFVAFAVLR